LCSEEGKQLHQFSQRFLNTIKLQFPATGSFRQSLLKGSRVFIFLRGCTLAEAKGGKPNFTTEVVWHIGVHYLSPFRPTFREVMASGDFDSESNPIPVVGGNNFFTFWPAMQKLNLGMAWFARFYKIRESSRFLGAFEPANAWMVPLQTGSGVGSQFWPPTRRTKGKHLDEDAADCLDFHHDSGEENEDNASEQVALDREMHALLDKGLAAMQAEMQLPEDGDDAGLGGAGDAQDDEYDPGPADPNENTDPSSSDSSSSSSSSTSRAARGNADIAAKVDGGTIRYYANKKMFTATCNNPAHGKCVLTRQSTPAKASARTPNIRAKGRPLGMLCAWLELGTRTDSKAEHWSPDNAPDHASRIAARSSLANGSKGRALLSKERDKLEGEHDEPAGLA